MKRSTRTDPWWPAGPAAALLVLALAGPAPAGVIATDDASDPAYANGWQGQNGVVASETGSDNGGSGFLPWNFDDTWWEAATSPYPEPHFIDTKPSSFNQLGAPAFALTNGNAPYFGYTTTATRPFAAALAVGDQISVDVDNPLMQLLAPFDSCGFIIQLITDKKVDRFGLYTTKDFNDDQWTITDSRGDESASGFTDLAGSAGFRFALLLTEGDGYLLTITPLGGAPQRFGGQLAHPGGDPITRIQFVTFGNGSGDGHVRTTGEREFYFNHLRIESGVPPPPNGSPTISSATPAGDVQLAPGASRDLAVQASDPDGDHLWYAWDIDGVKQPGAGSTFTFSRTAVQAYQTRVTVSDGRGGQASHTWTITVVEAPPTDIQKPSDCNHDGQLDISDAICLLFILFGGGTNIPCGGDLQGAGTVSVLDANGDHSVDISDAIWTLGYLFTGSAPPALGQACQSIAGCPDNSARCTN
jgi:hypothetical protein